MAKKNKEKIMKFKVIVEKDEYGYYVADVPELQGCHTQAKDKRELMKRVKWRTQRKHFGKDNINL